jgi:hypothetical protein
MSEQQFLPDARSAQERPGPNDRDASWDEAFSSQLSDPRLRRGALNVARRCVSLLHQAGAQVASSLAEDLVANAIADTWLGRLSWDPARVSEHARSWAESSFGAGWLMATAADRGARVGAPVDVGSAM